MPASGNLFRVPPVTGHGGETFDTLLARPGLRVERIVSTGQASPPGFWYEQQDGEWVVLLSGEAGLRLEGEAKARVLKPGDWIDLPAGCRHRVDWTDPSRPTVWLAVHYPEGGLPPG